MLGCDCAAVLLRQSAVRSVAGGLIACARAGRPWVQRRSSCRGGRSRTLEPGVGYIFLERRSKVSRAQLLLPVATPHKPAPKRAVLLQCSQQRSYFLPFCPAAYTCTLPCSVVYAPQENSCVDAFDGMLPAGATAQVAAYE